MKSNIYYNRLLSLLVVVFFVMQIVAGIGSGHLVSKTKILLNNEYELFKDGISNVETSGNINELTADLKIRKPGGNWEDSDITATVETELEFKIVVSSNKVGGHLCVIVTVDLPLINDNPMFSYVDGSASNPLNFIGATDEEVAWYYTIVTKTNPKEMTFKAVIKKVGTKSVYLTAYSLEPNTDPATNSVQVTGLPLLEAEANGPYSGTICESVQFSGSAIGGYIPYSWDWDFGDSSPHSYQQNPSYTYDSDGDYTAKLTVTDNSGNANSDTASVHIETSPLKVDAGDPYSGTTCESVQFSGSATGGCTPYSWHWDFGDEETSNEQNPSHRYTSDGDYTAKLTVTDNSGNANSDTASVHIETSPLIAEAGGPYSGIVDSPILFDGSASGGCPPYSWHWDFGDGRSSNEEDPEYTYVSDGDYTATLTVTDSQSNTDMDTVSVHVDPSSTPLESDAGGPYYGMVGESIQFYGSASGGKPTYSWYWEFGDGETSPKQNPTHSYDNADVYKATLTVTDSNDDSDTDTADVTVDDELRANANGPYTREVGETVQFHGSATGGTKPYTYNWDFGDGTTSEDQDPKHAYNQVKTYAVILTVHDNAEDSAIDETTATITEQNDPPEKPDNPSGPTSGNAGTEYTYSSSTTDPDGDQIYYLFDWGDGSDSRWLGPYNSGKTASASHTWTSQGSYQVKVKAKDTNLAESPWSDPLSVSMPKKQTSNKAIIYSNLRKTD